MKDFLDLVRKYPSGSMYILGALLISIGIGGIVGSIWAFMIALGVSTALGAFVKAMMEL